MSCAGVGDCVFNKKRFRRRCCSPLSSASIFAASCAGSLKILARAWRGDCGRPSFSKTARPFLPQDELAHIHVRDEHLARRQLRPSWRGHFAWARRDLAQAGHVTSTSDLAGRDEFPREAWSRRVCDVRGVRGVRMPREEAGEARPADLRHRVRADGDSGTIGLHAGGNLHLRLEGAL